MKTPLDTVYTEVLSKFNKIPHRATDYERANRDYKRSLQFGIYTGCIQNQEFRYSLLRFLIKKYGKTNKQIAEEVFQFVSGDSLTIEKAKFYNVQYQKAELYGYYSSFDHCCLAWLFGKMIDLPNSFPMLTYDLKQELDRKQNGRNKLKDMIGESEELFTKYETHSLIEPLNLKEHPDYPKQENLHSAIHDARWNKQLYKFLEKV